MRLAIIEAPLEIMAALVINILYVELKVKKNCFTLSAT